MERERDDLNNYRPISVLPLIARVFEEIIYKQFLDFFNSNKLLSTKQWGFRNLHSNNWYINIDKGDTNGVISLDIKKAFDTIDHSILLEKLSYYGASEDSLLFIRSYLINRAQCCSVNGKAIFHKANIVRISLRFHSGPSVVQNLYE